MADKTKTTETETNPNHDPGQPAPDLTATAPVADGSDQFTPEGDAALEAEQLAAAEGEMLDRDAMRAKIFGAQPESRTFSFFGVKLELRQPPMATMLEARQGALQNALLMMLVRFAYVPGTDENVFTEEDTDKLAGLPLGPDIQKALQACNELMGVDTAAITAMIKEASKGN
jgi:hypothetical protein